MAKGFSFTPEQDRRYALGWPHVRTLADKHKLDKKPEETAKQVLEDPEPPALFGVEWPRETAHRYVRALLESPKSSEWEAALHKTTAPTPEEAKKLVDKMLGANVVRPQLQVADFLLLLEAMLGTEFIADAICSRFERYQPKDWLSDALKHAFFTAVVAPAALPAAYHLGFFLLRLPDAQKKKFRARIEALMKKAPEGRSLHLAFDLVLHGSDAVRRNRVKALCACHHVLDDPGLIRTNAQTDEHVLSLTPRLVYLGGPELLDHFSERAKALPRWAVLRFAEEFGTIKNAKIVPIMLTLSQKKMAKDVPLRWFADHEDLGKAALEEMAVRKSPQGEAARLVIEQLKAPKPAPAAKTAAKAEGSKKSGKTAPPPPKGKAPAAKPAPAGKPKAKAAVKHAPSAAAKSKTSQSPAPAKKKK